MSDKSDTPRTDMEAAPFPISIGEEAEFDWVPAEFAKELERELAAAHEEAQFRGETVKALLPYQERAIKAEVERDALREALLLVLDQVDYTAGACALTNMVGACLPLSIIDKAKAAIDAERAK